MQQVLSEKEWVGSEWLGERERDDINFLASPDLSVTSASASSHAASCSLEQSYSLRGV